MQERDLRVLIEDVREGRLVLRPAANTDGTPPVAHRAPQAVLRAPSSPGLAD